MLNYKEPKLWIFVLSVVIVILIIIELMTNPKNNNIIKESYVGYIILEENTLSLDEVEMIMVDEDLISKFGLTEVITPVHEERIIELGLTECDMPNGYYIHNPSTETILFELADQIVYTFVDYHLLFVEESDEDRLYMTNDKEKYIQHLMTSFDISLTGKINYPVFIEVENGKVVSLTEKFILTQ